MISVIRMAPVLEFGNELWYSKENFTFATLPQYIQEDWKKFSTVDSFAEFESAIKQLVGNPFTNFLFDWFTKECVKIYNSNPTTFDKMFLQIAVKAEVQFRAMFKNLIGSRITELTMFYFFYLNFRR